MAGKLLLLITFICVSIRGSISQSACGQNIIVYPENPFTLTSELTQGCRISIAPSSASTAGLGIKCDFIQMCDNSFWSFLFCFNSISFNGLTPQQIFSVAPSVFSIRNPLILTYVYQNSWGTGVGFQCSFYALKPTGGTLTTEQAQTTTEKSRTTTEKSQTTTNSVVTTPSGCSCGKSTSLGRIVEGTDADRNEYPYAARLAIGSGNFVSRCGGTIISENYILTAAHCLKSTSNPNDVTVTVGDNSATTAGEQYEKVIKASEIILHENYDASTEQNDIALIKLSEPLEFNAGVQPACLPTAEKYNEINPTSATAVGWGTTQFQGTVSNNLQEVTLPIITNKDCVSDLGKGYDALIFETSLCTNDKNSRKDACQGDSGGPLAITDSQITYLAGITSWGVGCGTSPGVYTRVSQYISWINAKTGGICIP